MFISQVPSVMYIQKLHHFCNRSSPDDVPNRAEISWKVNNHRKYINRFPPNIIKPIRKCERINKKICRQKMSIIFNEICINEEMLPKYTYTYIYIYHHHQVVPPARISLTLSCHFSLSFIAFGRSSALHPVSSHNCCIYVRMGRPAFAWSYAEVHRSTSLMSSSLLLQQCPACLVRLTLIVFVMGGNWSYSWCLVGCWHQDLFNIALNILV